MTSYPMILGDGGHTDGIFAANRFSNVGIGRCAMMGNGFTNETSGRQRIHVAGTMSELIWGLDQSFSATETLTLKLRKNATDTTLLVSFPPSTTGWGSDVSDSVAVSSGDWLDFEADIGSGSTTYSGSFNCASARFTATTGSAQMFATVGPDSIGHGPEMYGKFLGILDLGNESDAQFSALTAGTWEYLACHVATNSFDGSTTVVSRINGSDGNMAITIPSAVLSGTGNFEDVTHSDSISANYSVNYGISKAASTGFLGMDWIGCHYFAATQSNCMIGGTPNGAGTISGDVTRYGSLFGGGNNSFNVTRATGTFPYSATLKDYSNNVGGHGTCTLMINGMPSNLAVSPSGGATGWLTDTSHTVGVLAGETCANRVATSGSQSMTWNGAALVVVAA